MTFKSLDAVYSAIDDLNAQPERKVNIEKKPDVMLLETSGIDSLDLVNLIVGIEQFIEDETGKIVTIVNEAFMSEQNSPLKTVNSLAIHIDSIIAQS